MLMLINKQRKMPSKIQNLIKQALVTFDTSKSRTLEDFDKEFIILKHIVENFSVKDISLWRNKLSTSFLKKKPKVEYVEIFENPEVTIGVFILQQGAKLPLHDHPQMHGILKVLQGSIKVNIYSVIGVSETESLNDNLDRSNYFFKHPIKVNKHPEILVNVNSNICVLTPIDRNIHEIKCINGPAAFLDVLSPPYEENGTGQPRSCHFFKEMETRDNVCILKQIPFISEFSDETEEMS